MTQESSRSADGGSTMVVNPYMTRRQRVATSMLGVGSGLIAVPLLLSTWAPLWVVWVWFAGYAVINLVAYALLLRSEYEVEQWWSAAVGVWFGVLSLTATVWAPDTRAYWIAAAVTMVFIAFEVSILPYVHVDEWRLGVVAAGGTVMVAGMFELGPLALTLVPVLAGIISSADQMRKTKTALELAQRRAVNKSLEAEQLANVDDLTGLLNRRGIAAEIERLSEEPHTLLLVDANRFKSVNDGHGYEAGDQVIQQIGRLLRQRLGPNWLVGRQGGDEFVAVTPGVHTVDVSVCEPVACEVRLFGTTSRLHVGLSGGYIACDAASKADRAVSKAAYAMRAAKRSGANLVEFDDRYADQFSRMLEVSSPTGRELRTSSLTAEFQIIVDEQANIVGYEALARWRRADGTLVRPEGFLQVLADNGQMPLLNEVMLEKGVSFAARFNAMPDAPFVAVNIGSPSLSSSDLVSTVKSLTERYNVPPSRLMIELTESEGFGPSAAWESAAVALRELGVLLAIDDFGSGYSNLERLGQLPISYLKFDRSLTRTVQGPLGAVASGVVKFASQTGTGVIAEGVETAKEFASMRALGVTAFQGYYFGRPVPVDVAEQLWSDKRDCAQKSESPATLAN